MEGMIWNANHVLEQALKPGSNGVPKGLFNEKLKGMILISVIEAGFIFSGNVGTGILMTKQTDTKTWSPPCAVGLTGVGWGFLVGGSVRDVMVFMYDDNTVAAATSDAGVKFGGQAECTIGPFGRSAQVSVDLSNKGVGGSVSVAFSKGAFLGLNIEGAIVAARHAANQAFYGEPFSPQDIVLLGRAKVPEGKVTLLDEVYDKLNKLAEGAVKQSTADEEAKKAAAKAAADAAAAEANKAPDVVHVDAAAEAAKE
jgi:lipid-binding SYLF domain-containing protein